MMRMALMGIVIAAGSVGCIDVAHQLVLEEDGSGALVFEVRAPSELVEEWDAVYRETKIYGEVLDTSPLAFDEAALRDAFKDFDPNKLSLEEVLFSEDTGIRKMRLAVRFQSLDALASANLIDSRSLSLQPTEDGAFALVFRIGPTRLPPAELIDPAMDFSLRLDLSLPADIQETNGRRLGARHVQWTARGIRGDNGLMALAQDAPRVVFGSAGLQIPPFGQQHIRLPGVAPAERIP